MERVIVNSLMEHFHKHNFISRPKAHHGFLKRLSTCTNLLESFNDWTLALQNHSGVTVSLILQKLSTLYRIKSCCFDYILMALMVVCCYG